MGKGKKVTVSYWYMLVAHLGLCKGPIDAWLEMRGGDRVAWQGEQTESGIVTIDAPSLYGGETSEGGVAGQFELMMGEPDQAPNSYLASEFGPAQSGYRGRTTIVLRGPKIGAGNPYPKPLFFKLRRILKGWDNGDVWYPEKAGILLKTNPLPTAYYIALDVSGSMLTVASNGQTRLANAQTALGQFLDAIRDGAVAAGRSVDIMAVAWGNYNTQRVYRNCTAAQVDDIKAFINSQTATGSTSTATDFRAAVWDAPAFFSGASTSLNRVLIFLTDGNPSVADGSGLSDNEISDAAAVYVDSIPLLASYAFNIDIGGTTHTAKMDNTPVDGVPIINGGNPSALYEALTVTFSRTIGMNPAHILLDSIISRRENGGMEEPFGRINEASFEAAADKFYSEGFGLCTTWRGGESAEQFQQRICNVIGANLTQSRKDGLYYLDPLRGDYVLEDLPVITDDDVISWEASPSLPSESINQLQVKWFDQDTREERITTPLQSLGAIADSGGVIGDIRDYQEIASEEIAMRVAGRDLGASVTPLWKFDITCTRRTFDARPGTYVRLMCPKRGFADTVAVIADSDYGNFAGDELGLVLLQDIFSLPNTVYVTPQRSLAPPTFNFPMASPLTVAVEAPFAELAATLNQADLDALEADAGFLQVAAARPPSGINYRLATALLGDEFEEWNTADWTPYALCDGGIDNPMETVIPFRDASLLDRVEIGTWALWDNEIVRVDAIDTVGSTLTLGRGCVDTIPQLVHADGSYILFCGDWAGTDGNEYVDGETVQAKALTRASAGQLVLDAAPTATVEMDSRQARPYPPGDFRINGDYYPATVSDPVLVEWTHRDRLLQSDQIVDTQEGNIGPEPGVTYTVRYFIDGILEHEETGIVDDEFEYTVGTTGLLRVELETVRDSMLAWQNYEHEMAIGAPLWTFTDLLGFPSFWINNESPITDAGGGALSQWNDISGSDLHLTQATSGERPVANATGIDGKQMVAFDGSNDNMANSSTRVRDFFRARSHGWMFGVTRKQFVDLTDIDRQVFLSLSSDSANRFGVRIGANTGGANQFRFLTKRLDADATVSLSATGTVGTDWIMWLVKMDWLTGAGTIYINGDLDVTNPTLTSAGNTSNTAGASNSRTFVVGTNSSNSIPADTDIAELLTGVDYDLTTDDIDKMFGHAAHKYDLTALLDVAHPYKTDAPERGPWTPARLTVRPYLWFSEKSRAVDAGSGLCSQWNDNSHNSAHAAQATGSRQPLIVASGINALRTIKADNNADYMAIASTYGKDVFRDTGHGWVFSVFKRNSASPTAATRVAFFSSNNSGNNSRLCCGIDTTTAPGCLWVTVRRLDADASPSYYATIPVNDGNPHMALWYMDWSTGTLYFYVDGVLDSTVPTATTAGNTSNTAAANVTLMATSGPVGFADAEFGEMVVGRSALAQEGIDKLFGYAAHKWGLTALLDVSHPYKVDPPML